MLALISIISCFVFAACQKSITPRNMAQSQKGKFMQEESQEQLQDGTDVFFILRNQELIQSMKHPPDSFYIKGIIENGDFLPRSAILGVGEMAKAGRYGWLELSSREFFPMESDKKAVTPFVKGYMTDKGFIPSVRDVFDEP